MEDRLVGGECSFWACMPSKALLRPYEALAEARRVPGAAEAITGTLDVRGRARPPRRDHPRPRRLVSASVARGARDRAAPRRRRAGGRAARAASATRSSRRPRAVILSDRVAAVDAADRGARRDRRRVDQPRGDHREGDPRAARDHGRRRGRRRDGAGLPDARLAGHADRGRAAAAPARGGVRVRAGDRGARGVRRRHPHAARRPPRRAARRRHGRRHDRRRRRPREGDTLLVALGRTPQTKGVGLEDARASTPTSPSPSTPACGSTVTRGCTRSAT